MNSLRILFVVSMSAALARTAAAIELAVPGAFPTIQSAIDIAPEGATVTVAAGDYFENIDFLGKNIVVQGAGSGTVLHAAAPGPVVRFVEGEGPRAILDSLTITGGIATNGGGILIENSSPTILRNVIAGNSASGVGSGIYIGGASRPLVANNLLMFNTGVGGGDPHTVQVAAASPRIVNNTIVRNDSNAILTAGAGSPEIRNNILARNGSRSGSGFKGRGICDFAAGTITQYNLFFRNLRAALLTAGTDFRSIRRAEETLGLERLSNNLDGVTRFTGGRVPRTLEAATPDRFIPSDNSARPSRAVHAGDPSAEYVNVDGTRNTIGFTGGPYAPVFD
jgi:parallel beta-helix repeat protein